MRIGTLARQLGTTPHAIRYYEGQGLLPAVARTDNGYREYTDADAQRLRLLIGLRQLDLPLAQAAEIAGLCADDKCDQVSRDLRQALAMKRAEIGRRVDELRFLDHHLARLVGQLNAGEPPRPLITLGKEDRHAS